MDPEILNESQILARLDDIRSQVNDHKRALEIWNSLSKIKNEFNDLEAKLAKEGSLSGVDVETMIHYEMQSIPSLQAQLNPYLVPYLDRVESASEAIELIRREAHYLEKHIPPLLAVSKRLQADRELAISVICYENSYRFANAQGKPLINEPSIAVETDSPSLPSAHDLSR